MSDASDGTSVPEVHLVVADRLDALERAVGTIRRRRMTLALDSVHRRDSALHLIFRAEPGTLIRARWLAELADLEDVREVRSTVEAALER